MRRAEAAVGHHRPKPGVVSYAPRTRGRRALPFVSLTVTTLRSRLETCDYVSGRVLMGTTNRVSLVNIAERRALVPPERRERDVWRMSRQV